ncbi:MAG: hypothetical protein ACRBI6_07115 [Acidimicrobiales bacterium]
MATLFGAATTATATLTGFAAGVVGGALPDAGLTVVAAGLAAALAMDLVGQRLGRPLPWTIGRQVPVEWSRWFDPRLVAVLYGARLGVAPLTILGTWVWWAVLALSATRGAVDAALVGAAFGVTRTVTTLGLGVVGGDAGERHAGLYGALRARPRAREAALGLPTLALATALLATACTPSADDVSATDEADEAVSAPTDDAAGSTSTMPAFGSAADAVSDPDAIDDSTDEESSVTTDDPSSTSTDPDNTDASDTDASDTEISPLTLADSLAADLVADVAGYTAIDDPAADTYLDLDAAIARQPDPDDERALLLTRGYEGGWTRAFRSADDDVLITTVYEFADDVQADFYLQDGLIVVAGYGGELFDIPELDGVHGFRQDAGTAEDPTVTWGLTFTDGNRWHLVFLNGNPDSASVDAAIAVAAEQAAISQQG